MMLSKCCNAGAICVLIALIPCVGLEQNRGATGPTPFSRSISHPQKAPARSTQAAPVPASASQTQLSRPGVHPNQATNDNASGPTPDSRGICSADYGNAAPVRVIQHQDPNPG